ncbi:hypothetical protein V6N13_024879 [Hibiscus sabdariffa]
MWSSPQERRRSFSSEPGQSEHIYDPSPVAIKRKVTLSSEGFTAERGFVLTMASTSSRQGYKILVEAEGGCDRVNMDVGTITAASTHSTVALVNVEGRNHAIYALGKDTR